LLLVLTVAHKNIHILNRTEWHVHRKPKPNIQNFEYSHL